MRKASAGLESLTATDRAIIGRMERRLSELRETTSLSLTGGVARAEKAGASSSGRGGRGSNQHFSGSDSRSKPGPSISNWSGELFSSTDNTPWDRKNHLGRSRKRSKSISPPLNHSTKRPRFSTSAGSNFVGESSTTTSSSAVSTYGQLFLRHSQSAELGKVFFDLTEISSDDHMTDDTHHHHHTHPHRHADSILEVGVASEAEMSPSTLPTATKLQSTCYLNLSMHPHAPPSVHHPRLLLCGQPGMGQSSYLGPALLHALEDLPVRTMDLATLFGSSTRSPEEACSQVCDRTSDKGFPNRGHLLSPPANTI